MVRHSLDGAAAVLLTTALSAFTPWGPVAPQAVLALNEFALLGVARRGGHQVRLTRPAAVGGRRQHGASPSFLSSAARDGTLRPLSPLVHDAIRLRLVCTSARSRITLHRIARLHFLERVCAGHTCARGELGYVAVALADSEAVATTVGPFAPGGDHAVPVGLAFRLARTHCELLPQASGGLAAEIGMHDHIAATRLVGEGATSRAC
mmetsp:Transcript_17139/g.36307  ORF Transcript_17139/g.36307 Transcript_17139/m.36307 type:complete len:207 (-) Transcript_17139:621-1241(-)